MEARAYRAKQARQGAGNLQPQTKNAVMQAHDKLSQFKHQLHWPASTREWLPRTRGTEALFLLA
jgi:hypothetical protein